LLGYLIPAAGKPAGPLVVIDPGHGGIDGGCQDSLGNLEKDINLAISDRLVRHLARAGFTPRLTRNGDRALGETYRQDLLVRLDTARRSKAAVMISLHANWVHDPAAHGALMVIPPGSPGSVRLAGSIIARLRTVCRVNTEPLLMSDHPLLAAEIFPVALVEVGFLSNPSEAARLQTAAYRDTLGQALALGIADYLRVPASPSAVKRE